MFNFMKPDTTGFIGSYENTSVHNQKYLMDRAINRDSRLNLEELEVYQETERVLLLGEKWWLRAHP